MAYISTNKLFISLDDNQEKEYRQWARTNFKVMDNINSMWHPVIQDECRIIVEQFTNQLNALNKIEV